mmetsp:Transcript_36322/g.53303  ORF Transcript_36322/g.53303 Transcript_36322/m.53303 type:complete len:223 (+) Transcript_36322:587-1255(+)
MTEGVTGCEPTRGDSELRGDACGRRRAAFNVDCALVSARCTPPSGGLPRLSPPLSPLPLPLAPPPTHSFLLLLLPIWKVLSQVPSSPTGVSCSMCAAAQCGAAVLPSACASALASTLSRLWWSRCVVHAGWFVTRWRCTCSSCACSFLRTSPIHCRRCSSVRLTNFLLGGGGGGHTPPPDACFPWGTLTLLLRTPTGTVPPPPALSAELQCVAAAYLYVAAA